jgi:Enoyl-CoA hydratase/isomerase
VPYNSDIGHLELARDDYEDLIRSPFVDEQLAGDQRVTSIVLRGTSTGISSTGSLPVVVAWVGDAFGGAGPANADVVVGESDVDELLSAIDRSPIAASTLAVLLRSQTTLSVDGGLAAESAAYSVLQAGPEFAAWRASATASPDASTGPVVTVQRTGDHLVVTLDRPRRHNAISRQLRDELSAALSVAVIDATIRSVTMRGNGPSFCSGGDLGEFGARSDPADAHITRLARSPSRSIHRLNQRMEVRIHGSTFGGGIEMAAFAGHVAAHPDTRIALPEISLGLIPGAGGTVSMTRRIGRQRTAALGLTGRAIEPATALDWGLIDEIVE